MKTLIAILILTFFSTVANADAKMDYQSYCATYGTMFKSIAAWRDQGTSPENTLGLISGVKGIPQQVKKDSIHTVYFDKSFKDSRGVEFGHQMRLRCLGEKPALSPLNRGSN
jgi:hypothetical protein